MKTITIIVLTVLCLGCKEKPGYPGGGFRYPKSVSDKDSNLYFYPFYNPEPRGIAFGEYYQYLLYRMFDEPNLSTSPQPTETVRLTFADAFHRYTIIVVTKGQIAIKTGTTAGMSHIDLSKLTSAEKVNLKLLNKYYDLDTTNRMVPLKCVPDSMLKLYPKLRSEDYYHGIFEKQFVYSGKKFSYETSMITVTSAKFDSLVSQIDRSGFWTMPHRKFCLKAIADGDDFTLEVNTKERYYAVTQSGCPNNRDSFTTACEYLTDLAGLKKVLSIIWE